MVWVYLVGEFGVCACCIIALFVCLVVSGLLLIWCLVVGIDRFAHMVYLVCLRFPVVCLDGFWFVFCGCLVYLFAGLGYVVWWICVCLFCWWVYCLLRVEHFVNSVVMI